MWYFRALGLPTKLAPYRSDTVYPAMIATTLSQYEYVLICDKSNIRVSGSPQFLCYLYHVTNPWYKEIWPSGLRRYVQVVFTKVARVRISQSSIYFEFFGIVVPEFLSANQDDDYTEFSFENDDRNFQLYQLGSYEYVRVDIGKQNQNLQATGLMAEVLQVTLGKLLKSLDYFIIILFFTGS
ncbi:hypothetical protein PHYBLDRAFT_163051 [Phycomyces blakesleeanus NRRL 1555(-)]|uniref:Uncharacterized protein n=1 Tax=Phycomyces blakesleeanus (strain ATCC 8743b / DSM 1359 / FGSC 10004 / NBRC 33097 / NRRL 1555) TaxID=763407 RepID=A0A167QP89_PHYB8|nr:hypothetical protein PHYBLDRAFT_163051 [Phycomyces blakesleeanus NRRL 1555(-)]OAD80001.1 hypothetical protein PHYBLDRAFT_163051 [Phycomyces blakesleeanus NRRL 1555(-)]|eukprot:XP_018298041.1 hypothetical protein PHYBLDRAFT_163051 [Phycomyces blakesleeanus NRRL 1555(-)]